MNKSIKVIKNSKNILQYNKSLSTKLFTINNNNNNDNKREIFTKINTNELGVRYTFGKIGKKTLSPGLTLMLPLVHSVTIFDTRPHSQDVTTPSMVTKDGVVVDLNTLVQYKIVDPIVLTRETPDHDKSIKDIIQIKLVELIPTITLDKLIHKRDSVNTLLLESTKDLIANFGIELISINITDTIFSQEIQNAISKKAQSFLLKEARMISARAELESSHILLEAANELEKSPLGIRIREIELLQDIAKEPSKSSFIFAPSSLFEKFSTLSNNNINNLKEKKNEENKKEKDEIIL